MTIKLLWLQGPQLTGLRVFAGVRSNTREYAGDLTFEPELAELFRQLLHAGEQALGLDVLDDVGWVQPASAST